MTSIRIDNKLFEYKDSQCQFSFGTHATLYLTFDLKKNPTCKDFLLSLYDNRKTFDMISVKWTSQSNVIKSIDIDTNKNLFSMTVKSEIFETIPTNKRRDDLIDDILDKTLIDNNSINSK